MTHKYCCVCYSTEGGLVVIPLQARLHTFKVKRVYIPRCNRCCRSHLVGNRLKESDLDLLRPFSNTSSVEASEIVHFINSMSERIDETLFDTVANLSMPEEQLKAFTGLSWANMTDLRNMLRTMRDVQGRSVLQALFIFLFRLRTGSSNRLIANVLGLKHHQEVSNACNSVLRGFQQDVLPFHFGPKVSSRDALIREHTNPTANRLHNIGNHLALVYDGTYLKHQKSSNNEYQRRSYSGQKKTNLCKPFTICLTDGFVLDLPGPFQGTMNDATILKRVLDDREGISSLLRKGDIFIVDRGFRDVKDLLESRGYKVLMPALKGKRAQLPTDEANESRMVTKCRWVVEGVHGILSKKFKLLHNQFDNKMLTNAASYCKIACLIHNLFGKRLNSDEDTSEEIVNRMLCMKDEANRVAERVAKGNLARRTTPFRKLTSRELLDFPKLSERELIVLFTGTYQMSQAVSYLAEILDSDGKSVKAEFYKDSPSSTAFVRFRVQSRHVNRRQYKCYIEYRPDHDELDGIRGYYCECGNGMRTVGCCAHTAAIISYLSHLRWQSTICRPAEKLTNLFKVANVDPVIATDSEDDD